MVAPGCARKFRADGKSAVSVSPQFLWDLQSFRARVYRCAGFRADALFELTDAILTAGNVPSPAHLSLAPVHRRGWCSLYAALRQGRIDADSSRDLLAGQPFDDGLEEQRPKVYAVDVSPWPRCDAEASPERAYHYHPSRHSAGTGKPTARPCPRVRRRTRRRVAHWLPRR